MKATETFASLLEKEMESTGSTEEFSGEIIPVLFPEWEAVQEGKISEQRVLELYAEAYGLEILENLEGLDVSDEFVAMVPIDMSRQFSFFGLAETKTTMVLVTSNPHQVNAIDDVARLTGLQTVMKLAPKEAILAAINRAYEKKVSIVDEVIEQWDTAELNEDLEKLQGQEDLLDMAHRAPVIKLVNSILFEAIRHNASDIHIQPKEHGLQVRLRIDGILYDRKLLPIFLLAPLVSRIKIMGRMNVSERRLAQDGRCTARIGNRVVDLRISSIPCSMGERVVLRLLDKTGRILTLEELGMQHDTLTAYDRAIHSSHGIVLITGPTGSGKTTTLYASLQRLHSKEKNILTLEDPIEYQLDGISQTQVSSKKGMTFASGLRHVLRQDPDVIMVGEIRDEETARMAVQSSLTGHLVFSTLHTNDSAGAIARILDLGIEPYLVASSLLGVLAQRLVRRLCPHCREAYDLDRASVGEFLGDESLKHDSEVRMYRESGCSECLQRGFTGRIGIFEYLHVSNALRRQMSEKAEASQIRQVALAGGLQSLRSDGIKKASQGITSLNEIIRVTQQDGAKENARI